MTESDTRSASFPKGRVTLRFCSSNLAAQAEARRIREALRHAPQAFIDHVVILDVRCADRCELCDRGPMVVVDGDAIVPATLQRLVDEVTRRVAPERLRGPARPRKP